MSEFDNKRHFPIEKIQIESLAASVSHLLEEARMVLPGIQALFGFQLIAVFNVIFQERLLPIEQYLHFLATGLVAIAFGLILTPAAYHRQAEPEQISERFVVISSRLLRFGMLPLMLGVCMDFYLIGILTTYNVTISIACALLLFFILILLWYILPQSKLVQRIMSQ
jgi:hypothetical protein